MTDCMWHCGMAEKNFFRLCFTSLLRHKLFANDGEMSIQLRTPQNCPEILSLTIIIVLYVTCESTVAQPGFTFSTFSDRRILI